MSYMENIRSFNYEAFGRICELISRHPYHQGKTLAAINNSIAPAVKHGRCFTRSSQGKLTGFCTFGFFTREEIDSDEWHGNTVYSRIDGDVLYFPKFHCEGGYQEVRSFTGAIRSWVSKCFPHHKSVEIKREYISGRKRYGKVKI